MVWNLQFSPLMKYAAPLLILSALVVAPANALANPASATPRASVAAVMTDAGQALLFDRIQGEYVVVRAGDFVQGYRVATLEADQVVLTHPDAPGRYYVLPVVSELRPVGERTVRCGAAEKTTAPAATPMSGSKLDLIDPYGQVSDPDSAILRESDEIPTVLAPPELRAGSQPPVVEAPATAAPPAPATAAPPPPTPSATPTPEEAADEDGGTAPPSPPEQPEAAGPRTLDMPATVVQPAPSTIPAKASQTIRRGEFDRALADFHALSQQVQISIRAGEVHVDDIATGSYFHRLGLRKGDVLVSVAGQPVSSLDAAASVYARLMTTNRFAVVVKRGAHQMTLRYKFAD